MARSGRVKLMDSLQFLLNSDEGQGDAFKVDERSSWEENAFNTMPNDK